MSRLIGIANVTMAGWGIVTIPGYYFVDSCIMDVVYIQCAIFFLFSLFQYLLFRKRTPLLVMFIVFVIHVLNRPASFQVVSSGNHDTSDSISGDGVSFAYDSLGNSSTSADYYHPIGKE